MRIKPDSNSRDKTAALLDNKSLKLCHNSNTFCFQVSSLLEEDARLYTKQKKVLMPLVSHNSGQRNLGIIWGLVKVKVSPAVTS